MHYLALLVAAYVALNNMDPSLPTVSNDEWQSYKQTHGKEYASGEEEALRRIVFSHNKQQVEKFNANPSKTFQLEVNKFSDQTEAEMAILSGFRMSKERMLVQPKLSFEAQKFLDDILNDPTPVPDSVDWRKVPNRVTPVKDQGKCGSCWAFSTVGTLEGQEIVHGKKSLIPLSEQNLLDCQYDNGCMGGNMLDAMWFIKKQGGIEDENSYPYTHTPNNCSFNKDKAVFTDDGGIPLGFGDEERLKRIVAKYGPVSVAIDSSHLSFHYYKGGVYKDAECDPLGVDHAVLVVGYDTDKNDGPYWIVKNSWGTAWGEKGYIKMARNCKNMCGIATFATLPYFKK